MGSDSSWVRQISFQKKKRNLVFLSFFSFLFRGKRKQREVFISNLTYSVTEIRATPIVGIIFVNYSCYDNDDDGFVIIISK